MFTTSTVQRPDFRERVEYYDGINSDIITVLEKNVPRAIQQTREFARQFEGDTVTDTAENIWNFLRRNITYKKDSTEYQNIRLPSRFIHSGTGDCKSYSLTTAAILKNLGLPAAFRYANYRGGKIPTHVYTVTKDENGREIIIDGVYHRFNAEKPPTYKFDHPLRIATLSGFDLTQYPGATQAGLIAYANAINSYVKQRAANPWKPATPTELRAEAQRLYAIYNPGAPFPGTLSNFSVTSRDPVKNIVNQVFTFIKKGVLAVPRNAFLGLVALNFKHMGSKLKAAASKDENGLRRKWESLGGSYSALQNSFNSGAKKPGLLGIDAAPDMFIRGIGVAPAAAPVGLAVAAPIIAAMATFLKSVKEKTGVNVDVDDVVKLAAQAGGIIKSPGPDTLPGAPEPGSQYEGTARFMPGAASGNTDAPGTFFNIKPSYLIGGALVVGTLYYLSTRKKKIF